MLQAWRGWGVTWGQQCSDGRCSREMKTWGFLFYFWMCLECSKMKILNNKHSHLLKVHLITHRLQIFALCHLSLENCVKQIPYDESVIFSQESEKETREEPDVRVQCQQRPRREAAGVTWGPHLLFFLGELEPRRTQSGLPGCAH